MPKYRQKPVIVEAFQVPPAHEDLSFEFLAFLDVMFSRKYHRGERGNIAIPYPPNLARPNDWIGKFEQKPYYRVFSDEEFKQRFEEVEND